MQQLRTNRQVQKIFINPEFLIARSLVGAWRELPVTLSPTPKVVTRTARLFLWQLLHPSFQSHHSLLPCFSDSLDLYLSVTPCANQESAFHFPSPCGLCDLLYPDPCLSIRLIFSFHLMSSSQIKLSQFNPLPQPCPKPPCYSTPSKY